jgi:four helix bundle protein
MHDFTKLDVWRRAVDLASEVARAIPVSAGRRAPGLRAQAVRAVDRISDAIAEGCGKSSDWELARFADIAAGSVTELQNQIVLSVRHGILPRDKAKVLWRECVVQRKMLYRFQQAVRARAQAAEEKKR